ARSLTEHNAASAPALGPGSAGSIYLSGRQSTLADSACCVSCSPEACTSFWLAQSGTPENQIPAARGQSASSAYSAARPVAPLHELLRPTLLALPPPNHR